MAGSGFCPFLELRILGKCGCLGRGSSACEQFIMGAGVSLPSPSRTSLCGGPLVTCPQGVPAGTYSAPPDRLAHQMCVGMLSFLRQPLLYLLFYYAVPGIEPTALAVLGRTSATPLHSWANNVCAH